ncbi:DUF559 domain-containing protein [Bradyrhizobium genosp. A]|uniref:DUF559 domain-containing protein n=1 Tax=Bradyrhizobium genosp. A TaxID=83626 RepID=UPI003CE9693E
MSKKGGIDLLADQLADAAANRCHAMFASVTRAGFTDSPIEAIFYIGLCEHVRSGDLVCFDAIDVARGDGDDGSERMMEEQARERGSLLLVMQKRLLDWRADFVLSAPSETDRKLIIECDWHDFHERTKEQAARDRARDRAAVGAGYRILRFTGSEIYRDPMGCIREALKHAAWLGGWDNGAN